MASKMACTASVEIAGFNCLAMRREIAKALDEFDGAACEVTNRAG